MAQCALNKKKEPRNVAHQMMIMVAHASFRDDRYAGQLRWL